jgi:transposase
MREAQYKVTIAEAAVVRKKMKTAENPGAYRRLMVVALRGEGKRNAEIAEIVGIHPDSVGKIVRRYALKGVEGLLTDGRRGGNHRNISQEKEEEFLAQFKGAAGKGQILTVGEIAAAYDEYTGKRHVSKSTVYYLLHKLSWRKVMPRSKHPNKASDEALEASKKLTVRSEERWEILPKGLCD